MRDTFLRLGGLGGEEIIGEKTRRDVDSKEYDRWSREGVFEWLVWGDEDDLEIFGLAACKCTLGESRSALR